MGGTVKTATEEHIKRMQWPPKPTRFEGWFVPLILILQVVVIGGTMTAVLIQVFT